MYFSNAMCRLLNVRGSTILAFSVHFIRLGKSLDSVQTLSDFLGSFLIPNLQDTLLGNDQETLRAVM